jgi:hypothetical protein
MFNNQTLNNNDNARIMTPEALATMADSPRVPEGLVASTTPQESPLVQATIPDGGSIKALSGKYSVSIYNAGRQRRYYISRKF